MRRLLRAILLKPVLWAASRFSSKPSRKNIFPALDKLYKTITEEPGKRGPLVPFEEHTGRFIIFSDMHKGARNGADDFMLSEVNYLEALRYYHEKGFTYICLGDSEELWENSLSKVKKHNEKTFAAEELFHRRGKLIKAFGNHDLYWDNDPFASWQLKSIYGSEIKVYEGVVLETNVNDRPFRIFCTHGHQGDAHSDGNWFSKFFVARIWAPLQAYLRINPNTPAYDSEKKTLHNTIMYEWSSMQNNLLLITGHTHQPVFGSLTYLERLYKQLQLAQHQQDKENLASLQQEIRKREKEFTSISVDYMAMRPSYFNSGCCCFIDGDITGIEIDNGCIRLIKWKLQDESPAREVLEEIALTKLAGMLNSQ